jgi:hypothetical protein
MAYDSPIGVLPGLITRTLATPTRQQPPATPVEAMSPPNLKMRRLWRVGCDLLFVSVLLSGLLSHSAIHLSKNGRRNSPMIVSAILLRLSIITIMYVRSFPTQGALPLSSAARFENFVGGRSPICPITAIVKMSFRAIPRVSGGAEPESILSEESKNWTTDYEI